MQRATSQHASIYRSLSKKEADFLFGYFPFFGIFFTPIYGLPQTLGCVLLFDKKDMTTILKH